MKIAVIPARGGSKRIPHKNIRPFCGQPMIAWSIDAARESNCFDLVVVSTDSDEIAQIAKKYGAEVPFLRPGHLADDHTGTIPVIAHTIQTLEDRGMDIQETCCIYATAPFIQAEDIRRGFTDLSETLSDFAFSVTSYSFPIQRAIRIKEDGRVEMFHPEHFVTRSQDLEEAWHDAGQFYWGRAEAWLRRHTLFGTKSVPVILPRYRVQDIDTLEDWTRAEWMFRAMRSSAEP